MPAICALSGLGMLLAEIAQRAILALGGVAYREGLPIAWVVVDVGYLAVFLLSPPAGYAGYTGVRRTGKIAVGVICGLGSGLLGGAIMGSVDSVARSVAPRTWSQITYPYGPPAGPLVAPAVLFAAMLVLFMFVGITGGYGAARLGQIKYNRSQDVGESPGVTAE